MQRRNFIESFAAVGAATGSSLFAVPSLATGTKTITETSPETAPEWIRDKKTGNFHINPDYCVRHSVCLQLKITIYSHDDSHPFGHPNSQTFGQ